MCDMFVCAKNSINPAIAQPPFNACFFRIKFNPPASEAFTNQASQPQIPSDTLNSIGLIRDPISARIHISRDQDHWLPSGAFRSLTGTYIVGDWGIGDSQGTRTPAVFNPRPTQELQVLRKW